MKKKVILSQLGKQVSLLAYIKTHFVGLLMTKRLHAIKHLLDKDDLINLIWKRCVILFLMMKTKTFQNKIFYTLELAPKNNWMTFLDKLNISKLTNQNTLHIQLFQILVLELISKEKVYKPFWMPAYKKLSDKLLLPIETEFQDLHMNLSNVSLQKLEGQSQYSMTKFIKAQNKNLQKIYYQLSTSTVVNKWEKEVINPTNQIPLKTLKIKLKPSLFQQKILKKWSKTSNYVYNKTIEAINKGDKINFQNLRTKLVTNNSKKEDNQYPILVKNIKDINIKIKNECDENKLKLLNIQLNIEKLKLKDIKALKNKNVNEWELDTPKEIRAGAVNDICKAYKTGFANLKAGNINHFRINFRKFNNNSFVLPKSFISNNNGILKIAPAFLKDTLIMGKKTLKKYKNLVINNDCRILLKKNEYWLIIPIPTIFSKEKTTPINYCGIDPGVRTTLTTFGNNGVVEYQHNKELLKKLNKKIDLLKSKRIKKSKLAKIEIRKDNLINEFHWKSINDLLKRNDYIFFGDIKSHDIVKKSNNKFLNRDFNDIKFHKYKQRLLYKSNILNKKVYMINEMYTTMTCSCCGNLNNVGKKEIYNCESQLCNQTLLRDISAAKNILMKGIINLL